MPLRILSKAELVARSKKPEQTKASKPKPYDAYTEGLKTMKVGQGGQLSVDEEGIGKQGIKLRLALASKAAGVTLKHLPSADNEVVFVVTEVVSRRQRKQTAEFDTAW